MDSDHVSIVLFIGKPGSGKGTQTELLAKKLGWDTLSSGDIFRKLRVKEGPLGDKVRAVYDEGLLHPDWFPTYLFDEYILNADPKKGLIAEGFCRSIPQVESFDEVLAWLGRKYAVIELTVSDEEAMRRQTHRNKSDERADSNTEEKIRIRLHEYHANTEPVLDVFRKKGVLIEVDGEKSPEEIAQEINAKLQPLL